MPRHLISLPFAMKKYLLFSLYLSLSLLIGEFHPFSQFPMYNSFPNYAYAFYVSNENEQLVPYSKNFHFNKNAGHLAHIFYATFSHYNYPYGYNQEDSTHLKVVGKELIERLLSQENTDNYHFDTLILYKRCYFLREEQIHYTDQIMYEKAVHP
jgi:hypothetical protein